MSKNIYQGYNPIYEQMASNPNQNVSNGPNPIDLIKAIYTQIFTTILPVCPDEELKSEGSLANIASQVNNSKDLNGIKSSLMGFAEKSLEGVNGKGQKEYLETLFAQMLQVGDVNGKIQEIKDTLKVLFDVTIKTVKKTAEFKATNESIVIDEQNGYIDATMPKAGADAGLDKDGNGREDENDYSHKWYVDMANAVLDQATAFKSETTPPLVNDKVAADGEAKGLMAKAGEYYNKALNLQVPGKRKGPFGIGKIITRGGKMSGKDFKIACENLADEIRRARASFGQIKSKLTAVPPPPPAPTATNAGTKKDGTGTGKGGTKKGGSGNTSGKVCEFPLKMSNISCKHVKEIQEHLSKIPCVREELRTKGGSDGKLGPITMGVIRKVDQACQKFKIWKSPIVGNGKEITKEAYDQLMAFETNGSVKESVGNKAFVEEHNQNKTVLSFEGFAKIFEEKENVVDYLCGLIGNSSTSKGTTDDKKSDDNKTQESSESINIPSLEEWQGIKYVNSGSYPVAFDESLLSAWTKELVLTGLSFAIPGSGWLLKSGSTALRELAIKSATKVGAKKLAAKLATKGAKDVLARRMAAKGVSPAATYLAKFKKIPIPQRTKAGLLGGTVGGAALDFISGRDSFIITIPEGGFIDPTAIKAINKGMINTIDGYVSDEDFACVSTVLSVIKGAWTVSEDNRAVSAWGELKRLYKLAEGEDLSKDIQSIKAKMGEVEGYPQIKSRSPLSTVSDLDWDIARDETFKFLAKLDQNETSMRSNVAKLPKEYVLAHANGDYEEVDEEGNAISSEETSE